MILVRNFAEALQQLVGEHGEEEIISIGTASGQVGGLKNPFVIHTQNDGMYLLAEKNAHTAGLVGLQTWRPSPKMKKGAGLFTMACPGQGPSS